MTHKKIFYVSASLLFVFLVVLLWPMTIFAGEIPTLRSIMGWDAAPHPTKETLTNKTPQLLTVAQTPASDQQIVITDTPEFILNRDTEIKHNENVIAALEQLVVKAKRKYLRAGWWLHTTLQFDAFITASAIFPNGDPIPQQYTLDVWEHVNPDGYVDKSYSYQNTGDATTSTKSVYENGIMTTYELDESWEQEPYRPDMGDSLLDEMKREKDKVVLDMKETLWHGVDVLSFSLTYRHTPIDMNPTLSSEDEKVAGVVGTIAGTTYTYYLSSEDGHLIGYEMSFIYPDGRTSLATRTIIDSFELVKRPPSDILANFK